MVQPSAGPEGADDAVPALPGYPPPRDCLKAWTKFGGQREIWGRNIRVKTIFEAETPNSHGKVPSIWEISVHDFVANLLMVLVVNTFPLKNSSATKYSDEWFVDAFGKFPNDTVIPFTGVLRTIH